MLFKNRQDAGVQLGNALLKYKSEDIVVLGIPRGGVVVAAEVARLLKAPVDVIIPRKLGAPHNPEVAVGAVTQDGTVILDEVMVHRLGLSESDILTMAEEVSREIKRRVKVYRNGRLGLDMKGKTVIVVDDGIATGFTVQAALKSVRNSGAQKVVLAVPVAPADTISLMWEKIDDLVCLHIPEIFYAVGQFYRDFEQVTDQEVIDLLGQLQREQVPR